MLRPCWLIRRCLWWSPRPRRLSSQRSLPRWARYSRSWILRRRRGWCRRAEQNSRHRRPKWRWPRPLRARWGWMLPCWRPRVRSSRCHRRPRQRRTRRARQRRAPPEGHRTSWWWRIGPGGSRPRPPCREACAPLCGGSRCSSGCPLGIPRRLPSRLTIMPRAWSGRALTSGSRA